MKSVVIYMANTGWLKLYRELTDKVIWQNSPPEHKVILATILMSVNYEENEWEWKGQKFKVCPGQMITSLESIQKKSGKGISIQNVRTALKNLEKYGFLTSESTNQGRLITVVNWELYQSSATETTSETTNPSQATNKGLTTIKERKKENKENKDIYGDFSNVRLSKDEYEKLVNTYSEKTTKEFVEKLDAYIASTGKKYKNHYATILTWIRKDPSTRKINQGPVKMTIDA